MRWRGHCIDLFLLPQTLLKFMMALVGLESGQTQGHMSSSTQARSLPLSFHPQASTTNASKNNNKHTPAPMAPYPHGFVLNPTYTAIVKSSAALLKDGKKF